MSGHVFGTQVQPIVAKTRQIALDKMYELFGEDWFTDFDEEQWLEFGKPADVIERKTIYCGQVMTFGEMLGWTKRFNQILGASSKFKNKRLEALLNDLVLSHDQNDLRAAQMYLAISEEIG